MELNELLARENVLVPLRATTVQEGVRELLGHLTDSGEIADPDILASHTADPARREVVAVNERVALPHYRTDAVDHLVVAIGVAAAPLDNVAESKDDAPARPEVLVLILAPRDASTFYLQTLSALARLFRDPGVVDRIAAARTPADVFAVEPLVTLKIQPQLAVRDIMVRSVESLPPGAPLRRAVDLIMRRGIRAIPVVGEKGEVLGLVSDGDVMRALLPSVPRAGKDDTESEQATSPETLRVRDVMSRSVLCISEDLGVIEVANMMINKDVEQLPVVREGKLTGILARGDIIRNLFAR